MITPTSVENYAKAHPGSIQIKYKEAMSRHTTFRIGGIADLYLIPSDNGALCDILRLLREDGIKYFILGNGSNVLFSDSGYRGAVISLSKLNRVSVSGNTVTADAGAALISVCKTARDFSLGGLEFAYGIPGSVGGAVYMNAGAYGGETAQVMKSSVCLDADTLDKKTYAGEEHCFGYRDSVYRHTGDIILEASFTLEHGSKEEITEKMNDFMNRRISKQPLDYPSAGSVFKRYPGRYTGQMIEECGLKGFSVGGAEVSQKHAGFIINKGGASAQDVLGLIKIIREKVYDKFGCMIECELLYVE